MAVSVPVSVPMAVSVRVPLIQRGPVGYAASVHEQDAVQKVFEEHLCHGLGPNRSTSEVR